MRDAFPFAYVPGPSFVHAMDARAKMACLAILGLCAGFASLAASAGLLALAGMGFFVAGLGWRSLGSALRPALVLGLFIVLARSLFADGPALFGAHVPGLLQGFSRPGAVQGLVIAGRLAAVIAAGSLFALTTSPGSIRAAAQWFLGPVPFVNQAVVATMAGLVFRFIPVVFADAAQVMAAQKARGLDSRKNPVYRARRMVPPMVSSTLSRAQDLSEAMVARGFSTVQTPPVMKARRSDILISLGVTVAALLLILVF